MFMEYRESEGKKKTIIHASYADAVLLIERMKMEVMNSLLRNPLGSAENIQNDVADFAITDSRGIAFELRCAQRPETGFVAPKVQESEMPPIAEPVIEEHKSASAEEEV
jgi:hypothetical protein